LCPRAAPPDAMTLVCAGLQLCPPRSTPAASAAWMVAAFAEAGARASCSCHQRLSIWQESLFLKGSGTDPTPAVRVARSHADVQQSEPVTSTHNHDLKTVIRGWNWRALGPRYSNCVGSIAPWTPGGACNLLAIGRKNEPSLEASGTSSDQTTDSEMMNYLLVVPLPRR
jgi:hypothetical protein